MSQYPEADVNTCYIDAIVDLKTGKTYVGRTIKNPYVRFVEHRKFGDPLGKEILMDDPKFVVFTLEVLPRRIPCALQNCGIQQHRRVRENSWITRLNTFQNGCNARREIAKPRYPPLPSHGFGIRPVKRSRHGTRVTKVNGGYQGRRMFLPRDRKRRILYVAGLVNNRPHLVQSYLSK